MRVNESGRSPGVREVALAAGVSRQTVSRVLNDHPNIRTETRERVLAAMTDLNFRPNHAARILTTARSRTIGVLAAPGPRLFGPASSIDAIEQAARDYGYFVAVAYSTTHDLRDFESALSHLVAQSIEGIVIVAPQQRSQEALAAASIQIPSVTLHEFAPTAGERVFAEQVAAARIATHHLVECGHRRILHLSGPEDWSEARARRQGFLEEAQRSGVVPLVSSPGDWSARSGAQISRRALADSTITAVFSANDQMALGVLHTARALGRRIPDDLAVVGFDDIPEAAYFSPPLTTMRQDFVELGRRAVERLLDDIHGGSGVSSPGDALLTGSVPRLIVRESTSRRLSATP